MRVLAVTAFASDGSGGFHQQINAVRALARACGDRHRLELMDSLDSDSAAVRRLVDEGTVSADAVHPAPASEGRFDRWLRRGPGLTAGLVRRALPDRAHARGVVATTIDRIGPDLAYFAWPNSVVAELDGTVHATTVWDLCHLDHPEFPEVSVGGQWEKRERRYRATLPRAALVIADSEQLRSQIRDHYGVPAERVLVMPFSPSPMLEGSIARPTGEVLDAYGLRSGYLFYPAQFWAHKNHVAIVEALALLSAEGSDHRVVFAGSDRGTLEHVRTLARTRGVEDRISFLGYVPDEDLRGLYEGAHAVVMPTYFGPTNLPPLEAWAIGRPLVYSAHLSEMVEDAALLVDVERPADLAAAVRRLEDAREVDRLVAAGRSRLDRWYEEQRRAEVRLAEWLDGLARRRATW